MQQFAYTITDPLGIHARPAGMLAKVAKAFTDTTVTVTKAGITVRASQFMKLISLVVKQGDWDIVAAEGPAETEAIAAMQAFFRNNL